MKLVCLVLAAGAAFAQTTRYPGVLDSDSSLFVVMDNIQTTLTAAMSTSDTAMVVASGTGFVPNMIATICDTQTNTGKCTAWEHMLVTAVSGNVLTVTRGFAGTSPRSHSSGRLVSVLIDSAHQKVLKDAVVAIETALGPNLSNISASGPLITAGSYNFSPYSCNSSSTCSPGGPSGMSLIAGNNTLTMTPVPNGMNGTDTGHSVYISGGTGAAEACTITGGAGTSGQASGQIIINCASSHSGAWTLTSASAGLQEAICSLPVAGGEVTANASITLRANVSACGKTAVIVNRQAGALITGNFLILGGPSTSPGTQKEVLINPPVWNSSRTDIYHGFRTAVGNFPPTAEFGNNTLGGINVLISTLDIPAGATSNAGGSTIAGYARTASAPAVAVGLYGEGLAAASDMGISAWGINTRTQNCDGQNCNAGVSGVNLYGYEADINLYALSGGAAPLGNVVGVQVVGGSTVQPTGNAVGIHVRPMGVFNGIGWKDGIYIEDGAVTNSAITIGAAGSGNNVSSMSLIIQSRTSAGATTGAQIFFDPLGDLHLKPGSAAGFIILDDLNLNAALAVKPNGTAPVVSVEHALILAGSSRISHGTIAFSGLGAVPAAGTSVYCTNCTVAATCAAGGPGHMAVSNGAAWTCQ